MIDTKKEQEREELHRAIWVRGTVFLSSRQENRPLCPDRRSGCAK